MPKAVPQRPKQAAPSKKPFGRNYQQLPSITNNNPASFQPLAKNVYNQYRLSMNPQQMVQPINPQQMYRRQPVQPMYRGQPVQPINGQQMNPQMVQLRNPQQMNIQTVQPINPMVQQMERQQIMQPNYVQTVQPINPMVQQMERQQIMQPNYVQTVQPINGQQNFPPQMVQQTNVPVGYNQRPIRIVNPQNIKQHTVQPMFYTPVQTVQQPQLQPQTWSNAFNNPYQQHFIPIQHQKRAFTLTTNNFIKQPSNGNNCIPKIHQKPSAINENAKVLAHQQKIMESDPSKNLERKMVEEIKPTERNCNEQQQQKAQVDDFGRINKREEQPKPVEKKGSMRDLMNEIEKMYKENCESLINAVKEHPKYSAEFERVVQEIAKYCNSCSFFTYECFEDKVVVSSALKNEINDPKMTLIFKSDSQVDGNGFCKPYYGNGEEFNEIKDSSYNIHTFLDNYFVCSLFSSLKYE